MAFMAIPAVAYSMMAVSTLAAAAGTVMSAQASSQAADYQAKVAANNATVAQQNATYAKQAGAVQEQQARMKTAALIGNQKAAEASNGFDLNSGSNLDLQAGAASVGEMDAQTIRSNSAWRAYGYQSQSSNFQAEAGLDSMRSDNAMTAGFMGAAGNLIGGASALSGMAMKLNPTPAGA